MRLFHFLENPGITLFRPHIAATTLEAEGCRRTARTELLVPARLPARLLLGGE